MIQLVKTYYDISKFVLWGDDGGDGENNKRPRMTFSFRDGNPRFVVYPGQQGVIINYPCDYTVMATIASYIKDIATAEPGTKLTIDSLGHVYKDNKATSDKKVVSTLHIGKSKEGIVYLSVIAEEKPKVVFWLKPSPYHIFRDETKTPIPDSVLSTKIAIGVANLILETLGKIMLDYTREEYETNKKPTAIKGSTPVVSSSKSSEPDDIFSDDIPM